MDHIRLHVEFFIKVDFLLVTFASPMIYYWLVLLFKQYRHKDPSIIALFLSVLRFLLNSFFWAHFVRFSNSTCAIDKEWTACIGNNPPVSANTSLFATSEFDELQGSENLITKLFLGFALFLAFLLFLLIQDQRREIKHVFNIVTHALTYGLTRGLLQKRK